MYFEDNILTPKQSKLYPFTPNKKQTINFDIPYSNIKFSTNYTKRYMSRRNIFQNVYKTYNKHKNKNRDIIHNNNTDYFSLVTNPNNLKNEFINKSVNKRSQNKIKVRKGLLLSLIKSPKKNYINKNNFTFIPKKYEITNMHKNLMEQNKLSVILKQEREIRKLIFNENKKNEEEKMKKININLNRKTMFLFEKEYDKINPNKKTEKYLILKEINNIGKKLSFANVKKIDDIMKDIDIENKLFSKRVKEKDSLLEINQVSTLPSLGRDQKLVFDLWKKDMIKYCKLTLDENNKDKDKFEKDLLCVYN